MEEGVKDWSAFESKYFFWKERKRKASIELFTVFICCLLVGNLMRTKHAFPLYRRVIIGEEEKEEGTLALFRRI